MPNSLTPGSYSFGDFDDSSQPMLGEKQQKLLEHCRSLQSEVTTLLDRVDRNDTQKNETPFKLYRQLLELKKQATLLEKNLADEEFPAQFTTEDLAHCAHNQIQGTINQISKALNKLGGENISNSTFLDYFQGDSKLLLFIKNPDSNTYSLLGNLDNLQKFIGEGTLSLSTIQESLKTGQFGVINLREKVCCSGCKQLDGLEIIPHPNLKNHNKRAVSFLESKELDTYEHVSASYSSQQSFQNQYEQSPFVTSESPPPQPVVSGENIEDMWDQIAYKQQTTAENLQNQKDQSEKEEKKANKWEQKGIAEGRRQDMEQDATAAKKRAIELKNERIDLKLKERRDDDRRTQEREYTSIQRKLDIKKAPPKE